MSRLKSCVSPGPIAIVSSAFQIKNLMMEVLVTLRSFQVIFECAMNATIVVAAVAISVDNHNKSLLLMTRLARIEYRP